MNRIPLSEQTKIKRVLDQAIATVAEQEFNRLCNNLSEARVAERVKKAIESMGNLRSGDQPEYSEWDALFYVTWYQPRQINVALTILRQLYEITRNENQSIEQPLHIIDVGCGALAAQFAIAILLAYFRSNDAKVFIKGIDPSIPMKEIGRELWSEFCSIVAKEKDIYQSDLSQIYNLTKNNLFYSLESYDGSEDISMRTNPANKYWLMAVHTIYESNKQCIKKTLQNIRRKLVPDLIMVTAHEEKRNMLEFVVGNESEKLDFHSLLLKGELPKTTEWRQRLIQRLPEDILKCVRGLLKKPVQWNPSNCKTSFYLEEFKS